MPLFLKVCEYPFLMWSRERALERKEFARSLQKVLRQRRWIVASDKQAERSQRTYTPIADKRSLEQQRWVAITNTESVDASPLQPSDPARFHWQVGEYMHFLDSLTAHMILQLSYTTAPDTDNPKLVPDPRGKRIAEHIRRRVSAEALTEYPDVRVEYPILPFTLKDLEEQRNISPYRILPWLVVWDEYIGLHVRQVDNIVTPVRIKAPVRIADYGIEYALKTVILTRYSRELTQTALYALLQEFKKAHPDEYDGMLAELKRIRKTVQNDGLKELGLIDLKHLLTLPLKVNLSQAKPKQE